MKFIKYRQSQSGKQVSLSHSYAVLPSYHFGMKAHISHAICSVMRCGRAVSAVFKPAVCLFAYLFSFYYARKYPSMAPIFSLSTSVERYCG